MRISPREIEGELPTDLRYIGRWPRMEQRRLSDSMGGWLQDCIVKVGQGSWIFALALIGLAGGILTTWMLPAELWWGIISAAYFILVLGIPAYIVTVPIRRRDWAGTLGSAIAFALLIWVAIRGFDEFIWDPLDKWTQSFFTFRLPVLNGWGLAMLVLFGILVVAVLIQNRLGIGVGFLGMFGSLALWLYTCEFTRPGLMFYLLLTALDTAYVFAALGTIAVLRHEQADVYEPYGSESPPLEPERPAPQRFRRYIQSERRWTGAGLLPPGEYIEVTGPKMEEWIICTTNLVAFIEDLPIRGITLAAWKGVRLPAGLLMIDQSNGEVVIKDEPITQWPHWAPYRKFLIDRQIFDGKNFYPEFRDNNGGPDVTKILAELRL